MKETIFEKHEAINMEEAGLSPEDDKDDLASLLESSHESIFISVVVPNTTDLFWSHNCIAV